MCRTTQAVQVMEAPPGKPTESQDAEQALNRRLGEDDPRAWALAWSEAGLTGQASTMPERKGHSPVVR